MDRTDGRFSIQNNDKTYSHSHPYVGFWVQSSSASGNQKSNTITSFPTTDNLSKCSLMKILVRVAGPSLKILLRYITEDKLHSDTLETYALKHKITPKWLTNHFTDVQLNIIRKNPNYEKFDLTLTFRCIELFKDLNQTVTSNKSLNDGITEITKQLKYTRDNLCHNREHMTKSQCLDKSNIMKVSLGDLLEIIQTWDKYMDIFTKKKETDETIDQVMNEVINEEDFIYLCLHNVLNLVVEPTLKKVTQTICWDKKKENFREYLLRKGMPRKKYKKDFFDEEKVILQSYSEVKSDVTLHTKIIDISKEWHYLLKDDSQAKDELKRIIRQIRAIRNNISHSMLSMSITECNRETRHLRNCLEDLGKFIEKKIVDPEDLDAPVIDIKQINHDIDFIMSAHNTSLPSFCHGN